MKKFDTIQGIAKKTDSMIELGCAFKRNISLYISFRKLLKLVAFPK
jgi:hypothetical protein